MHLNYSELPAQQHHCRARIRSQLRSAFYRGRKLSSVMAITAMQFAFRLACRDSCFELRERAER